jgi:hypothetical protein
MEHGKEKRQLRCRNHRAASFLVRGNIVEKGGDLPGYICKRQEIGKEKFKKTKRRMGT